MATILLDVEGTLLDSREATRYGLESAPHSRALASQKELDYILQHPPALYPGIRELLQSDHRFALVTLCTRAYTEALIHATGLTAYLHCWFCADDSDDKAELVRMALKELGRPAFLLGDRPGDLEAAQAHKVEAFGAGWSYAGADLTRATAVLAHPLDLLKAIG